MQRQPQPSLGDRLMLLRSTFANADPNSAIQTQTPKFVFPERYVNPIHLFSTHNPASVCIHTKDWLFKCFDNGAYGAAGIVRMEGTKLEEIDGTGSEGWVLMAEDVACLSKKGGPPVSVLAVLVPGCQRVRWFYTVLSLGSLLQRFDTHGLLTLRRSFQAGTPRHRRFFVFLREEFAAATSVPHSADFVNAETMTDCCPEILDKDSALQRLEKNEQLYFANKNPNAGLDISDDRYLLHLHPAEREIASMVGLKCAEYMLVKRNYFKAFFEDIYRSDKKLEDAAEAASAYAARRGEQHANAGETPARRKTTQGRGQNQTPARQDTPFSQTNSDMEGTTPSQSTPAAAPAGGVRTRTGRGGGTRGNRIQRGGNQRGWNRRVRTLNAHKDWLAKVYPDQLGATKAKLLAVAWQELGFLDEGRYLGWVKAGGMLAENFGQGEEYDGDGEHDEVLEIED